MKKLQLFTLLFLFLGCASKTPISKSERPKNVILLIGDGMGLTQVSSAFYFGEGEPNFARFPVTGLSRTSSSSHKITDSAAGATALSCGVKTYNGAVGVDDKKKSVETLVERASKYDLKTAVLATSSITHATPASFYAHAKSRNEHESIASQLVASSVDFFAGSGKKYFFKREDGKNLMK
ncbi:MAG: alkaline phosphatase, partial [Bacteroidota bacterium]